MVAIDREVGGSTMIRVSWEVREMIEEEKIIPREPLNDCIKRGILENRKYRTQHPSLETRDTMETEIKDVVCNSKILAYGGITESHVQIYLANHPGETLAPGELIHHINGNHNDNRIENLIKISPKQHGALHTDLNDEFPPLNSTKGNTIVGKDI